MGYGDLSVTKKGEFFVTICLMFIGVIFYSNILTELLNVLEIKLDKKNEIAHKTGLMQQISLQVKIPQTVQRQLKREIIHSVEFAAEERKKKFIPNFRGVNQKDVDDLLYQAYTNKFDNTVFEGFKDKKFLIRFAQSMEEVNFAKKQIIYERGDTAKYFYLIK